MTDINGKCMHRRNYLIHASKLNDSYVPISGNKNAALPILVASTLCSDIVHLSNIPLGLIDIQSMIATLKFLNIKVTQKGCNEVTIDSSMIKNRKIPAQLMGKTRYSILLLGALANKFRKYSLAYPGGCNLGSYRPIDLHIAGLRNLGINISLSKTSLLVDSSDVLKAGRFRLRIPSVGATENIILAAVLTPGTTIIKNSSIAPEVLDLCAFLNKCGAKITGHRSRVITIEGINNLKGVEYSVIPDRIEIGSFIAVAVIGRIKLILHPVIIKQIDDLISVFKKMGVRFQESNGQLKVDATGPLKPVRITTSLFPGFPTDMSPILAAACLTVKGESRITDTVFPLRNFHVKEFRKLGANIIYQNGTSIIVGGHKLRGAKLYAHNIRSGAAQIIAALTAEGITEVTNVSQVERGYEHFADKLRNMGADVCIS